MQAQQTLLPDSKVLRCDGIERSQDVVTIRISATSSSACCPNCGRDTSRIHSYYQRTLADLPWHGVRVIVRWRSRKFFCDAAECPRRIFTERLPQVAAPHARKTMRLQTTLLCLGVACGGEGGARLCERLGISVSPDLLLRSIRSAAVGEAEPPRVVGIDDWAFRRGQRYGTIVCDLERRRPIALLPERSSEVVRDWLVRNPNIQIVSRDRGDCYIKGATDGAPQALPVADRWHLLKNAHEALVRVVERYPQQVRHASRAVCLNVNQQQEIAADVAPQTSSPEPSFIDTESRKRHYQLYLRIKELTQNGVSVRAVAKQLGIQRATVRRYARADSFPERAVGERRRGIDSALGDLRRRWNEGCRNARQLTRDLRDRGFLCSYGMVRRQTAVWRKSDPAGPVSPAPSRNLAAPSAKQVAWMLLKTSTELESDERRFVEELQSRCLVLNAAARLTREFGMLIRKRNSESFDDWLERCRGTDIPNDLRRFADGLRHDYAAVRAAMDVTWSNGQTEGQINRLKLIKRQMYGRAKLDLLRQRFLLPA